jgi:hypothetical protein
MVSIQLEDSVAAALAAKARAEGLSLQAYLERLAGAQLPAAPPRLIGDELQRLFDEASVAGPDPSCTYTRADIYLDHD